MQYVNDTKDFFWIDYFDAEIKTESEKTVVATNILPIETGCPKNSQLQKTTQDKSGNLSVSFSQKGTKNKYELKKQKMDCNLINKLKL